MQPVIHPDDRDRYASSGHDARMLAPGPRRRNPAGLGPRRPRGAVPRASPTIVLVHDAARPFASAQLIARAIDAAEATGAAIPGLPVADTVKTVDAEGRVTQTLERAALRLIQTPQAFAFAPLLAAHRRAAAQGRDDFTDDAALAEWAGMTVAVFAGEPGNIKITDPEDFARAEAMAGGRAAATCAPAPASTCTLSGPAITSCSAACALRTRRRSAAIPTPTWCCMPLTDAILGALADGDIGAHFPPSDPQWRGASSDRFLAFAVERVAARGGLIAHLDITVVCEAPQDRPAPRRHARGDRRALPASTLRAWR